MASNRGQYGLVATIDDQTDIYVLASKPDTEQEYHSRFYLDPNSLTMTSGDVLTIFDGRNATESVFKLELRYESSNYQIRINTQLDDDTWTATSWYTISDAWQAVELSWKASSLLVDDGNVKLWVDAVVQETLGSLDNASFTIEEIRLGAMDVDTGTSGSIYNDDFKSMRFSNIGVLPSTGPVMPAPTAQPSWLGAEYNYESGKAHAVSSVVRDEFDGGSHTDSYTYDANGNMFTRVEDGTTYTHTYNAENRLESITKGTESWYFTYDGDGVRVYEQYMISDVLLSTRYFFGGGVVEIVADSSNTITGTKKYYSMAGQMIAMDDGTDLVYFATDHLSSTSIVMSDTGTLLSEQRYLPFGGIRTDVGVTPFVESYTDLGYTNQRNYGDFGLMDYNARFYSPLLGRLTQLDTIIPALNIPQTLNRFTYAFNSPIVYNDPSGNCPWCLVGALVGAAIGYGSQVVNNLQDGMELGEAMITDIAAAPIINGAFMGAFVVFAAPLAVAAASEVMAGVAVTTGSFAWMEASILTGATATGMATTLYGPISGTIGRASEAYSNVKNLINGPSPMSIGNKFHYDELNGSHGQYGPTQVQRMFPNTDFEFTRRGQAGPDVKVVGGMHPSSYSGSQWTSGYMYGDFKPNTASGITTFAKNIASGKFPADTYPLYYNPGKLDLVKELIME